MQDLTLDFETASAADLKAVGAWRYSEDLTTEVLCLGYGIEGQKFMWRPGDDLAVLIRLAEDPEVMFVAHNAGFEKAIWRNIMVPLYGLPDVGDKRWDDTLACCAMKSLPLDLDRATNVLRLPNRKDKEASNFTKKLSRPNRKGYYDRSPESLSRVYKYCESDIEAEEALRSRLGPLPAGERNVWLLDQRINQRGILLDLDFIAAAQRVVDEASVPLVSEFVQITGFKPSQAIKVKEWVEAQGVWIDNLSKESVAALLGENIDEEESPEISLTDFNLPENVRRALHIRSLVGSASVKKLKRMKQCVGMDGRVRGTMQYHGATPGRWSGRLFQPHNFPRGTIKDEHGDKYDPDVVVKSIMGGKPLGPPIESVVSSLRHAIKAAPGKVLLSGDFAGVEARLVLAASGQEDKRDLMASGKDVYCDMATSIYRRIIDKKKDPEERQTGKNTVLGLGFGMGWKKFKIKYGQKLSEEMCQHIIKVYRDQWAPAVPSMWKGLEQAALQTLRTERPHDAYGVLYELNDLWLTARLPSGRKLWYFQPTLGKKAMPWDEKDIRIGWSYRAMKMGQFKEIHVFGGLLTENVIQGLARDLMVSAMFKLEKNGFPIILTVHDEIVCEVMAADADEKAFKQIMQEIPEWAKRMQVPVSVETWVGERYRK